MTTLDAPLEFNNNSSSVQGTVDIIVYAVHTLGYWPTNSMVLVTTGAQQMGPLIRVNNETISPDEACSLLDHLLDIMPDSADSQEKIDKFFLLIFGAGGKLRARQLTTSLYEIPSMKEIEDDAKESSVSRPWVEAGKYITDTRGLAFCDLLFVGSVSRWEVDLEESAMTFSGFIEDVLKSPIYLDLLLRGSTVMLNEREAHSLALPSAAHARDPQQKELWLAQASYWLSQYEDAVQDSHNNYCADYLGQKFAENRIWDATITEIAQTQRQRLKEVERKIEGAIFADHLREILTPQMAGYLLGTLTSVTSAQFILFTASSSLTMLSRLLTDLHTEQKIDQRGSQETQELPSSSLLLPLNNTGKSRIDQCLEELLHGSQARPYLFSTNEQDSSGAEGFADILMGNSLIAPDWKRLAIFERIIAQLIEIADAERLAYLKVLQAWICWFKGLSTPATLFIEEARLHENLPTLPLDLLLENSLLPYWLNDGKQCFRPEK